MASDVGIVNAALRKLGQSPITAFSENSKAGRLASERFAEKRDELLSRHPWNFAEKRSALAVSATAPAWGFSNAYPLPADYIRMRVVNGEDEGSGKWKVEDGSVVTDLAAPLEVLYTYQVEDANRMSAGFREALASLLAADWAEDITGDSDVVVSQERKARVAVAQARSNDGQEGIPDQIEADEWTNARL
jgi:hypothetical protein